MVWLLSIISLSLRPLSPSFHSFFLFNTPISKVDTSRLSSHASDLKIGKWIRQGPTLPNSITDKKGGFTNLSGGSAAMPTQVDFKYLDGTRENFSCPGGLISSPLYIFVKVRY